jgi:hypothetical protein
MAQVSFGQHHFAYNFLGNRPNVSMSILENATVLLFVKTVTAPITGRKCRFQNRRWRGFAWPLPGRFWTARIQTDGRVMRRRLHVVEFVSTEHQNNRILTYSGDEYQR